MEKQPFEDVSPIKNNRDFPASHVSELGGVLQTNFVLKQFKNHSNKIQETLNKA